METLLLSKLPGAFAVFSPLIDVMPVMTNGTEVQIQDVQIVANIGWDSKSFLITTGQN